MLQANINRSLRYPILSGEKSVTSAYIRIRN